jgi:hypothetical protein
MIIRYGGGNSGIKEYLEEGRKVDRHFTRDELDHRYTLDGNLALTQHVIDSIADHGQERYLHISLSFNEPDVDIEKMSEVYEDYKSKLMTAFKDDEFNIYSEIHWPKIKEVYNHRKEMMEPRFPHIHVVIPKRNVLADRHLDPVGLHEKAEKYLDAIQEKLNREHGLSSPRNSPRIGTDHYIQALDRYKEKEFKSKNGELKQTIHSRLVSENIRNFSDFKSLVEEYGHVVTRNAGTDKEYLAVKPIGDTKFTNLKGSIFDKAYITQRALIIEPLTDAQVDKRLESWAQYRSREIRYIDPASEKVRNTYRAYSLPEKRNYLDQLEAYHAERYSRKINVNSSKLPSAPARDYEHGYSKFTTGGQAEGARDLHELRSRNMDNLKEGWSTKAGLLLSSDENNGLHFRDANRNAGLRHNPSNRGAEGRGRTLIDEAGIAGLNEKFARLQRSMLPELVKEKRFSSLNELRKQGTPIFGDSSSTHRFASAEYFPTTKTFAYGISSVSLTLIHGKLSHAAEQSDKERYSNIRRELRPESLLAYAQLHFGVDPDKHKITYAKDGSARINVGKYNYNVSDFLTKHIKLDWNDASKILKELYEKQQNGIAKEPLKRNDHLSAWKEFRTVHYPKAVTNYNELRRVLNVDSNLQLKQINSEFFSTRKKVYSDKSLSREERLFALSLNTLTKLQEIEALREKVRDQRQEIIRVKYPYSDLFAKYVNQSEAYQVQPLDKLRAQYRPEVTDDENTIGHSKPMGIHHLPTGAEAAQRAKLIAKLHQKDEEIKELKVKMKDLQAHPHEKGGVVFSQKSTGQIYFINQPDKVVLNKKTSHDEVALGLLYAMERFGPHLDIKGTKEFKEQIVTVAAEQKMDVQFTDPALNKALSEKRRELGLELPPTNSIEVADLKLDPNLPKDEAIDKALIESKVAELNRVNTHAEEISSKPIVDQLEFAKLNEYRDKILAETLNKQEFLLKDAYTVDGGFEYRQETVETLAKQDIQAFELLKDSPQQQYMARIIEDRYKLITEDTQTAKGYGQTYRDYIQEHGGKELALTIDAVKQIDMDTYAKTGVKFLPPEERAAEAIARNNADLEALSTNSTVVEAKPDEKASPATPSSTIDQADASDEIASLDDFNNDLAGLDQYADYESFAFDTDDVAYEVVEPTDETPDYQAGQALESFAEPQVAGIASEDTSQPVNAHASIEASERSSQPDTSTVAGAQDVSYSYRLETLNTEERNPEHENATTAIDARPESYKDFAKDLAKEATVDTAAGLAASAAGIDPVTSTVTTEVAKAWHEADSKDSEKVKDSSFSLQAKDTIKENAESVETYRTEMNEYSANHVDPVKDVQNLYASKDTDSKQLAIEAIASNWGSESYRDEFKKEMRDQEFANFAEDRLSTKVELQHIEHAVIKDKEIAEAFVIDRVMAGDIRSSIQTMDVKQLDQTSRVFEQLSSSSNADEIWQRNPEHVDKWFSGDIDRFEETAYKLQDAIDLRRDELSDMQMAQERYESFERPDIEPFKADEVRASLVEQWKIDREAEAEAGIEGSLHSTAIYAEENPARDMWVQDKLDKLEADHYSQQLTGTDASTVEAEKTYNHEM